MATVYTLVEQLKISKDPLEAGVITALLERVNMMEVLPFQTIGTLNTKVTRWKDLPTPAFRNLNATFTSTTGTTEQLEESVYVAGGNIDLDRQFSGDNATIVDPRKNQLDMFMAAMAYMINDYWINGDQATDPAGFTGLKVRIGNLPSRQTISADTGADGLEVFTSETTENTLLDKLDELIDLVEDGQADCLFMNTSARLGIRSVLRRLKLFETTRDMFDREVMTSRGALIYDMGTKADQSTLIMPNTESYTGGGNADGTSIYAVRFGRDGGEYLHGIDKHKLQVDNIGRLENGAQDRTNIEWPLGLTVWNPRSAARLRDLSFV